MSAVRVVNDDEPGMKKCMTGMDQSRYDSLQNKNSIELTVNQFQSKLNTIEQPIQSQIMSNVASVTKVAGEEPSQTTSNVARQYVEGVLNKADEVPSQTFSIVARQHPDEKIIEAEKETALIIQAEVSIQPF